MATSLLPGLSTGRGTATGPRGEPLFRGMRQRSGPSLEEIQQSGPTRASREIRAATGIASGIFRGLFVDLPKLIWPWARTDMGWGDLGKAMGESLVRTAQGKPFVDAFRGESTWTEAMFETVSNALMVLPPVGMAARIAMGGNLMAKGATAARVGNTMQVAGAGANATTRALTQIAKLERPIKNFVTQPIHGAIARGQMGAARAAAAGRPLTPGQRIASQISGRAFKEPALDAMSAGQAAQSTFIRNVQIEARKLGPLADDIAAFQNVALRTLNELGLTPPNRMLTTANAIVDKLRKGAAKRGEIMTVEAAASEAYARIISTIAWRKAIQDFGPSSFVSAMSPIHRAAVPDNAIPKGMTVMEMQPVKNAIKALDYEGHKIAELSQKISRGLDHRVGPAVPRVLDQWAEAGFTAVMMPTGLARKIKAFQKHTRLGDALDFGGKPLSLFRASVLSHSPRWAVNSMAGNTMLAILSDPGVVLDLATARRAFETARAAIKFVPDEAVLRRAPTSILIGGVRGELGRQGTITRTFGTRAGRFMAGDNPIARAITAANEFGDVFWRTAIYERRLKRHLKDVGNINIAQVERMVNSGQKLPREIVRAQQNAARETLKALVDYGRKTPFERHVLRSIFPFYSWQRGILRLAHTMPIDHPLRFALIEQVSRNFGGYNEEERQNLPAFMIPSVPLPGGGKLSVRGLNPFADVPDLMNPATIMDKMNPLFRLGGAFAFRTTPTFTPYGTTDISPIGFEVPQFRGEEQVGEALLSMAGPFRALLPLIPGAGVVPGIIPPRGEGFRQQAMLRGMQEFGIGYRSPEEIERLRQREHESRKRRLTKLRSTPRSVGLTFGGGAPSVPAILNRERTGRILP